MIFVSATKGIESGTDFSLSTTASADRLKSVPRRMEEVVRDVLAAKFQPNYVASCPGPASRRKSREDEPCAIVAASHSLGWAAEIQQALSSSRFRVYTNNDVVGVEIAGAIKNVMAIATGAVNGLGLGYNSQAALVTRGLAEMTRLAVRLGGRADTLAGLAGMGDLVLTCFGALSRNRRVGLELGRGRKLADIISEMREVAEGVKTAKAAHELATKLDVDMPITAGVYQMLYEDKTPRELELELMERPLKSERV
jgi:glycerol-3-phosphate dehydrogenase (NAD(P)+)